ncbi:hypothetical protein TWF569_007985 [Orbilia oligospora]|nr:hypothetical protein TWF569_007985 [Orbilia oligospora]
MGPWRLVRFLSQGTVEFQVDMRVFLLDCAASGCRRSRTWSRQEKCRQAGIDSGSRTGWVLRIKEPKSSRTYDQFYGVLKTRGSFKQLNVAAPS